VPWSPLNAGWFARPHITTDVPGVQHGGPPCGAGKVAGGRQSGCGESVAGDIATGEGAAVVACGDGIQNAGGRAVAGDSLANIAGGRHVGDNSGADMAGEKAVVRESLPNMAGGKISMDGGGVGGGGGACIAGAVMNVCGACGAKMAGGKTVVVGYSGMYAALGDDIHWNV